MTATSRTAHALATRRPQWEAQWANADRAARAQQAADILATLDARLSLARLMPDVAAKLVARAGDEIEAVFR
jgi:hypothetical protein